LGAYALKKERFDLLKLILNIEIIEKDINYILNNPIWSTNIFYPESFNNETTKIFDILINSYDLKDFLKDFFYSENDYTEFLLQFNFILCLYGSKFRLENSENHYAKVYPHFKKYGGDHNRLILFKLKTDYSFSYKIAEAFGESRDSFIEKYPERCNEINEFNDSRYGFRDLNCNIFEE
jgi:hypothetical protein